MSGSSSTKLLRVKALLLTAATFTGVVNAAASITPDPCTKISGKAYVLPADALACLKSFPFSEKLRQNVLSNVARVTDFFTFENYYLNSPSPFQESTINIRKKLAQLNTTRYSTDYDFNKDLFDFATQLNDGHTRWFPDCYTSFQNILPAPIVSLADDNGVQGVYVIPDLVEFIQLLGTDYTDVLSSLNYNWQRLASARVLAIEDQDPYAYIDFIARTVSGNYLDHGIRVNSVFSSYRVSGSAYSQRIGDLAGPLGVAQTRLKLKVLVQGARIPETIYVPYVASFTGVQFTDGSSFWQNNCAAKEDTNGVDLKDPKFSGRRQKKPAIASIIDKSDIKAVGLPTEYIPNIPLLPGSDGVIKSYILPDGKTGVVFVGSFGGDFSGFQDSIVAAGDAFKAAGVDQVLIDLTNNGGGYVCLGHFLHSYFAGSQVGYPGFVSTNRANPLARKIVAADIALGLDGYYSYYTADNWAFLNGTAMPADYNYMDPPSPFIVNGVQDPTSQRFHDTCELYYSQPIPETPPFDLNKIAIVTNGNCASTCALFTTLMSERHNTKIAVFGGKPGEQLEYKGMAGNQVLEWADLDTEIKTAGLKDDPLAPPDLVVSGNFRVNWRSAWSFLAKDKPIAYLSEPSKFRFPYTNATYNNPLNLWKFAATKLF